MQFAQSEVRASWFSVRWIIMLRGLVITRREGFFLVTCMTAFLAWQIYSGLQAG